MEIAARKKKESNTKMLGVPWSERQIDRYHRLNRILDERELESLHEITREKLDNLLNEIEEQLGIAS